MNLERYLGPSTPPRTHLLDVLRYWAEQRPDEPAFYFTDAETLERRLTYRQLWDEVRGLAGYLQSQRAMGERVLLLYPPGLDFVIGLFACHAAGAIAVPAYPPRRNRKASRIRSIAKDAAASIGLSVTAVAEQITGDNRHADLAGVRMIGTDTPRTRMPDAWQPRTIKRDDLAVLQYTSGSTGAPKGVMLTHANLMNNCELIMYAFEADQDVVGLTWLPTYHDMGLVGGVLMPLFIGRPNVLMSPMTFLQHPVKWLRAITRYGVTMSGGPNFGFQLCVDKIDNEEIEGLDLSSWTTAFNGAEPIRTATLDAFTEKFAPVGFRRSAFLPCYGMAETTLIVTGGPSQGRPVTSTFDGRQLDAGTVVPVDPESDGARQLIGCGQILPGERLEVVNPETLERLPPNRVGELWIQSPCVGQGYWRAEGATRDTFGAHTADGEGPFLRTGDLGFLYQGQLYISGRLKDMIIVRGVNRYPQDIEQTVEAASDVVQAGSVAAFAMEYQGREQLVIVAETIRDRDVDRDAHLQAIRRAVTAEHELPPDAVYLVRNSSVPKTSSGKIQRHACLHALRDDNLKTVAKWVRWEETGSREVDYAAPAMQAASGDSGGNGSPAVGGRSALSLDPDVLSVVIQAVRNVARERAGQVVPDTNIVLDLGLDSLERLQIAHALEQTFGHRFPEDVLQEIETIAEVTAAIQRYMGKNAPAVARSQGLAATADAASSQPAAISEDQYRFELFPEYRRLKQTMAQMLMTGVPNPYFTVHQTVVRDTTRIDGRQLISFASYNYLGMSGDPEVNRAAKRAIDRYGTSVSASRLVSGEKPLHRELEMGLAELLGVDDAITMVGGHATNETTIGHLMGPGDLILHDALAHNSIVQGAILSGARRRAFPHNDHAALDALLSEVRGQYRRVLVVLEGVYSMDGDFPDLSAFIEVKSRHRSLLMVDEAHSIGTMGKTGRGIGEHFGINPRQVDIWMGTLSKSFGSCGGYIAGSNELIELLRYTAPGFVFSVGMPPPATAAAVASLRLLQREPQRVTKLQRNSRLFLDLLRTAGLNTGLSSDTPVVPVITGNSLVALRLSRRLFLDGINVQPILYPAVEESAARLRFFVTSTHSAQQLRDAASAVINHVDALGLPRNPSGTGQPLATR